MGNKIWIHGSLADFNRIAATNIIHILAEAIKETGFANLLLSGGSTPMDVYEALTLEHFRDQIHWDKVHFFWGDERCVPADDENSNYGQAFQALLSKIPADPAKVHRIKGELGSIDAAADYIRTLSEFAQSDGSWPIFDVALMGLGEDGHMASIFPGVIGDDEKTFPVIHVTAHYQNRPSDRVTLTPLALKTSRNLIFLVVGRSKAGALLAAVSDEMDAEKIPVQRLQPTQGRIIWHVDSAAAIYIQQEEK